MRDPGADVALFISIVHDRSTHLAGQTKFRSFVAARLDLGTSGICFPGDPGKFAAKAAGGEPVLLVDQPRGNQITFSLGVSRRDWAFLGVWPGLLPNRLEKHDGLFLDRGDYGRGFEI